MQADGEQQQDRRERGDGLDVLGVGQNTRTAAEGVHEHAQRSARDQVAGDGGETDTPQSQGDERRGGKDDQQVEDQRPAAVGGVGAWLVLGEEQRHPLEAYPIGRDERYRAAAAAAWRLSTTARSVRSAGVIPSRRPAWPSVSGRNRDRACRASLRSEGMAS